MKPQTRLLSFVSYAFIIVAGALSLVPPALAQREEPAEREPAEAPTEETPTPVRQITNRLDEFSRTYDWDADVPNMHRAMENLWRTKGWNGPADQYALEVAHEIIAIPPWNPMGRLDLMTERLGARYHLAPEDQLQFKRRIMFEMGRIVGANTQQVFEFASEAFRTRQEGEGYTPEMVARWTKAFAPMQDDVEAAQERIISELAEMIPEEKRDAFQEDLEAFRARDKEVNEMMATWAEGGWKPADWGMEDDPIQLGLVNQGPLRPEVSPISTEVASANIKFPTRWVDYDPRTWLAYIIDFKRDYELDEAQVATVDSIHRECKQRTMDYIKSRDEALEKIPIVQRANCEEFEPVRLMFKELCERLEPIPRSDQRRERTP